MKIYETHAHYDDDAFDEDRNELISRLLGINGDEKRADEKQSISDTEGSVIQKTGVLECLINVGASRTGCQQSLALAEQYEKVYAAIGIHPEEVEGLTDKDMQWLKEQAATNANVVAIGEIGLDYHYPEPEKEVQIQWFRRQLALAREVKKPVIIHSREACADTIQCMKAEHAEEIGGVVHCYSYTKEAALDFLKMGFYFGIGGVVTFKNAKKLVAAVQEIPMDKLLLETDCPYMAPEPHRGKRNDSGYIPYVAEKIAEIKGMNAQEVIDMTNENAHRLFG